MSWTRRTFSKLSKSSFRWDLAVLSTTAVYLARNSNHDDGSEEAPGSHTLNSFETAPNHPIRTVFPFQAPVACDFGAFVGQRSGLRRHRTIEKMEESATRVTLKSKYNVNWPEPLGEGTFGAVYQAVDRVSGEKVAVKKIPKKFTDNETFQREMCALLRLRDAGGHPNICGLRENFDEGDFYFLVLDLIQGGEMFDQLCAHGAYSEADSARLVREVASALAFLHGIGIIHGDLKPENIMLSSVSSSDAIIQVVDFGCAQIVDDPSSLSSQKNVSLTNTPAYSAPEVLKRQCAKETSAIDARFDMWALGVIVYIMLTGVHPFDLYGNASNEEVINAIISGEKPPLHDSPLTSHLSADAISVIEKLLEWDPQKRWTADQLLEHPWVRGETARHGKIEHINTKLLAHRKIRTKIGGAVFKDMLSLGNSKTGRGEIKRRDLFERVFRDLDADNDGYLSVAELKMLAQGGSIKFETESGDEHLTLSDFYELLSEHMKNRYYPKGHMVYHEGDTGNAMYFLNSGKVEVSTKDGFRTILGEPGSFFGEGALLHPDRVRSGSIKCLTPVHAIEVSREYFEKYLAADLDVDLHLRTTHNSRRQERVRKILEDYCQKDTDERDYKRGEKVFTKGEIAEHVFLLVDGRITISTDTNHVVSSIGPGFTFGEAALLFKSRRNAVATCTSDRCLIRTFNAKDFNSLIQTNPLFHECIRENSLRREFQKAICLATKKPFPRTRKELRSTYDSFMTQGTGSLELSDLRKLLLDLNPHCTEEDVHDLFDVLDLRDSGSVDWENFQRLFGMETN